MFTDPMTIAPVPMFAFGPMVVVPVSLAPRADRHPRVDDRAAVHLDATVDRDLAVREVDAGMNDDRVADAELRRHHRESVHDRREQGNAESL